MATTVEAKIADLLLARAATLNDTLGVSPEPSIAWPNLSFTPPQGETWLETVLLPNQTVTRTIADDGSNQLQGFLQVTVVHPLGKGAIPASEIAGGVIGHFAKGTILRDGALAVKVIKQPWASPPMIGKDALRIAVSIPYVCFSAAT